VHVDLTQSGTITAALQQVRPDAIANCAGIVDNSDKAKLNGIFTGNLLKAVVDSGLTFRRIVVTGSAAEYGIVDHLPVSETTPLRPTSVYGESKVEEASLALKYRADHEIPVTVARLFNPIGAGMHPRMLIPSLVRQIEEIRQGIRTEVEVSRLDARRDYIDIRDVATAILALIELDPREPVYNIGSGRPTSNADLVDLILGAIKLPQKPGITQTGPEPEPLFANQADVTRLKTELGWSPAHPIAETIKEIVDGTHS